jgi:hypothetical protein
MSVLYTALQYLTFSIHVGKLHSPRWPADNFHSVGVFGEFYALLSLDLRC